MLLSEFAEKTDELPTVPSVASQINTEAQKDTLTAIQTWFRCRLSWNINDRLQVQVQGAIADIARDSKQKETSSHRILRTARKKRTPIHGLPIKMPES